MTEECFFCGQEFESRKEHDDHIQEEHDPNYKKNLYVFDRAKKDEGKRGEMHRFVDKKIKEFYSEDEIDRARSYFIAVSRTADPDKEIDITKRYNMDPADYEAMMAIMDESFEKYPPKESAEEEPEEE